MANMAQAMLIVDSDFRVVAVNSKFEPLFGFNEGEMRAGESLEALVRLWATRTSTGEAQLEKVFGALRKKEPFVSEYRQEVVGGPTTWIQLFHNPLPGGGFVRTYTDVTERHEVERLKKEFVSSVSHELRTPLTSIRGSLGLLRSGVLGALPPDAEDLVAVAERNVIRLIALINDILDLERLEDGRIEIHLASVAAGDVVARASEAVRAFAEQHEILLTSQPSTVVVRADADRLVQVLVNLFSNAVKFSPRGSAVSVTVGETGDMAEFRVADRGRGIPPALRAAIFERYRQVEASDTREKGGTGLGLAICKAIVDQHGGTIGVESREGTGSTFWFRVPLMASPRISASSLSTQAPRLALLVDDDVELLTVLGRQLMEKGIGVRTALSVKEALEALGEVRPDVLVLDLGLPDGDGQKVVDALKRDPNLATLPLLVYTGRDLNARDRESLTLGPTHHLTKSKATDEEVLRAVKELIKAGRAGRTSGAIRRG